ncbi:hypothetical protein FGO68_gene17338 [Halteria grandinella]|uniref:Uncharacterized protein n=1 Tax=Halteria grandinella TaxID=5974 RepID=A0A8J8SWE5_HALGN|nr:hypothetical protein FGO68_gene17338 [Halteria grandinella]
MANLEVEKYKMQNQQERDKTRASESQVFEARKERLGFTERISQLEEKLGEERKVNEKLVADISKARADLQQREISEQTFKEQLVESKQQLSQMDQDVRELKNLLSASRHEKETLLKDLHSLDHSLKESRQKHLDHKSKYKLHKAAFDNSLLEMSMFKDKLSQRDQEIERLRAKCDEIERFRRERSREASGKRRENEELRRHLEHFESIQIGGEDETEGGGGDNERMNYLENFKLISEQIGKMKEKINQNDTSTASLTGPPISRQQIMTTHSRQGSDMGKSFNFKSGHFKSMLPGTSMHVGAATHQRDRSRNNETHDGIMLSQSSMSNYSSNQFPGTAVKSSRHHPGQQSLHKQNALFHKRKQSNLQLNLSTAKPGGLLHPNDISNVSQGSNSQFQSGFMTQRHNQVNPTGTILNAYNSSIQQTAHGAGQMQPRHRQRLSLKQPSISGIAKNAFQQNSMIHHQQPNPNQSLIHNTSHQTPFDQLSNSQHGLNSSKMSGSEIFDTPGGYGSNREMTKPQLQSTPFSGGSSHHNPFAQFNQTNYQSQR